MIKIFLIVLLSLAAVFGFSVCLRDQNQIMPQKITFQTEDNVKVVGYYYEAGSSRAVLLLHMMPATKESWQNFAEKLKKLGISSLAMDLRGHGESTDQGGVKINYLNFEPGQHQASSKDVEAALNWLKAKGFAYNHIALVGASISANLALQAIGYHPEIKTAVAISPGSDYRGIQPGPFIAAYQPDQRVLFIASHEDTGAAITSQGFYDQIQNQSKLIMLENAGHGTDIFEKSSATFEETIDWLDANLPK